jgi:hypothetical protein
MSDRSSRAERLAALLDGRVDHDRRAAILVEVADSDEVAAVLAEAAAVLRELEMDDAGEVDAATAYGITAAAPPVGGEHAPEELTGVRVPAPPPDAPSSAAGRAVSTVRRSSSWWRRAAPWLAAAVALLALVPLLRHDQAIQTPADVFGVRLAVETRRQAAIEAPPAWSTSRSSQTALSSEARAARLGVRLADLQLAVERRDPAAPALARDVALLLSDLDGGAPLVAHYEGIAGSPEVAEADLREALRLGREAVVTAVGPGAEDILALAAWARFGQAAVLAGDRAFLEDERGRMLLERAGVAVAPDGPAAQAIARLSSLLVSETSADRSELRREFDELLDALTR